MISKRSLILQDRHPYVSPEYNSIQFGQGTCFSNFYTVMCSWGRLVVGPILKNIHNLFFETNASEFLEDPEERFH